MIARLLLLTSFAAGSAHAADPPPLELEAKVSLGDVRGRIDHLAIDINRQRLYVAELGNDSVAVVDLNERRLLRTVAGFKEPQGIGYVSSTDTLCVANAGDGSVRLFRGADLTPIGQVTVGSDADNVRVDVATDRVFVGYGSGAIAIIDTASKRKIVDISLNAHPESFQLDPAGSRLFANVPDAREIALVDLAGKKQIASWRTDSLRANYPMTLDPEHARVLSIFRHPANLAAFDARSGRLLATADTCGDADDVFFDSKRSRIYISCGEGFIDIVESRDAGYASLRRISMARGASTALFAPDLDRLMLAVPAGWGIQASLWIFRPTS